ncbi:MAG TPA: hypothetical protein VH062_10640 [Polyangiaceae bacterium]|jgi:hypothetical protein|nr:hypothetical protein [Polyangiaceae bacterium]
MTYDPGRPEDVLRVLGDEETPPDDTGRNRARRERTVAHLRGLQARAAVRREMRTSFRKRLLVAAALLIPSAALGASALIPWNRIVHDDRVETPAVSSSSPAQPSRRARELSRPTPPPAAEPSASSAPTLAESEVSGDEPSRARPRELRDTSTLADENRLMQSALRAARDGRNDDEIRLLTELLVHFPRSPLSQNAMVERFRALGRKGDASGAERQARRYLELHPNGMAGDEARRLVHGRSDVTR